MENDIDTHPLFTHFGTRSPLWFFLHDSDALQLSGDDEQTALAITLSPEQAKEVRNLTGRTTYMVLNVRFFDDDITLHLVGKKIDRHTWSGTAADYYDTETVARNLGKGLIFAEQVVSEVNALVVIIDKQGKIQRFNHLCEELTGLSETDLIGQNALDLFMPQNQKDSVRSNIYDFFLKNSSYQTERPVNTKHGVRRILWRNKLVESGSGEHESFLVCAGTDVTEERRANERLIELATRDTLTGLFNRHAIQEQITVMMQTKGVAGFSLLFLDLDNFKKVNDHYGHIVGDSLIKAAASKIQSCLRDDNLMARLGGDEFLIAIPNCNRKAAELVAQRIITKMKLPLHLERAEIYSSCSIGISLFPEHGNTLEKLVRSADMAMYEAKDNGRSNYRVFSADMDWKVSQYVWLDTNIRKALRSHQFELYYQPKRSLRTGKVESVEALLRWNSPERGLISPNEFIPYAEESGLISSLGKWVIDTAAKQAGIWKKQGLNLRIAVNVSARQFRQPNLVKNFRTAILAADIYPSTLDLEITESCLIEDEVFALSLMKQFRELGAEIHLDDFGTGYSSLSQLARLPLDVIKLDRSFICSGLEDSKTQRLLRSIVAVGQELHLKIVAEGIETPEQFKFLSDVGVDVGQGYFFAKPMPVGEFEKWMSQSRNSMQFEYS